MPNLEYDAWKVMIERRVNVLQERHNEAIELVIMAHTEVSRILYEVGRAKLSRVPTEHHTKIEIVARGILDEILNSDIGQESIPKVSDSVGLREQDPEELCNSDTD